MINHPPPAAAMPPHMAEFEATLGQTLQPQNWPNCGIPLWNAAFVTVEKQAGIVFGFTAIITLRSPVPVMDRGYGSYLEAVRHMIAVALELSGFEAVGVAECLSATVNVTHWRALFKPYARND